MDIAMPSWSKSGHNVGPIFIWALSGGEGVELSVKHHLGFRYCAPQGEFQLARPTICCELIDTDTTVELLADYILRQLEKRFPEATLRVVAYEGVGKGAIAER